MPLTGGAGEYRLRAPLRAIGQAGLAQTMICEPPKAFSVRILSPVELARAAPDAIIMHQPLDDPQTDALEAYKRFMPQVRRIITHNAADNIHMLRINTDLGWRPLAHKGLWSLSVS